ncbi:hypothetical protein [Variovorax sp. JS1663]|uniref:hypothetical protein n=1 Tax=Variovorax sp. JS1663 TaxID=1851577 RepID=UPI000B348CD0|nr:hypothetical protein [Variovorax sp. JS1663]OUL98534.1 hypothetical protein A8M77_30910 [Variovorax sp. JS1663]
MNKFSITAALCALILAGCATPRDGIRVSEEEAIACKAQGCSVWTQDELMELAREIFRRGVEAGRGNMGSRGSI